MPYHIALHRARLAAQRAAAQSAYEAGRDIWSREDHEVYRTRLHAVLAAYGYSDGNLFA